MPMRSQKQRAYLWANDPKVAKKMEKDTGAAPQPKGKKLPKKKKK